MSNNEPTPTSAQGPPSQELAALYAELTELRTQIKSDAETLLSEWGARDARLRERCQNLAHYVALRRRDLRHLQPTLARHGLSSLGRSEGQVLPTLDAVLATLAAAQGQSQPAVSRADFTHGAALLQAQSDQLFGSAPLEQPVHMMVTLPAEAASDPQLVRDLISSGMDCARINCGHDDISLWLRMVRNVRDGSAALGKPCRICMDLSGPRLRIADVIRGRKAHRLRPGDTFVLCSGGHTEGTGSPSPAARAATRSDKERRRKRPKDVGWVALCDHPEALRHLLPGSEVVIDGGIAACRVKQRSAERWLLEVTHAPPKGLKLKPEKGLNFPGTVLKLPALTERDREDLGFVAKHADLIGYSFVQRPSDVQALQEQLVRHGRVPETLGLILKIETATAVQALPSLLVAGLERQPVGVLIARGDLAAELGFERLPEVQEELLWLCEAAHVPVIWATQVLDRLVRKGTPMRAEVTDAAAAARAECVMLNKGPYLREALRTLCHITSSMRVHQSKKTARLGPLPW